MYLQTLCSDCIFCKESGCLILKKTEIEDEERTVRGFCAMKRNKSWMLRNNNLSLDSSVLDTIGEIDKENLTLCGIVKCYTNSIEDLNTTLCSIRDDSDILKKIVIVVNDCPQNELDKIFEYIKDYPRKWVIQNIKVQDTFEKSTDYIVSTMEENYFFTIDSGVQVGQKALEKVHDNILNHKKNIIYFYYDDYQEEKFFCNRSAFLSLAGNFGEPFIEKISSFEEYGLHVVKLLPERDE